MWFMTGLPNNQVAVFVKLHHAIADGMAAMAAISALARYRAGRACSTGTPLDTLALRRRQASSSPTTTWATSSGSPSALATLARPRTTVQQLRAAWPATRELLAETPAPETSLDRMVGPNRPSP